MRAFGERAGQPAPNGRGPLPLRRERLTCQKRRKDFSRRSVEGVQVADEDLEPIRLDAVDLDLVATAYEAVGDAGGCDSVGHEVATCIPHATA